MKLFANMNTKSDIFDDVNSDSSQMSTHSDDEISKEHVSFFELLVDKILNDANQSMCDGDDSENESMEEEKEEEIEEDLREKELYREIVKHSKKTYNLSKVLEDDELWQDIIEKADENKQKANQFIGSDESYFEMSLKHYKPHIMKIIRDKLVSDDDNEDSESSQDITQSGSGQLSDSDDVDVDECDGEQVGLGPRTKYDYFF